MTVTRTTGILPNEVGVVLNVNDPHSAEKAALYRKLHKITGPPLFLRLGRGAEISPEAFKPQKELLDSFFPKEIQALALCFQRPFRVGPYNSITSALARGYCSIEQPRAAGIHPQYGYENPYDRDQDHSKPFTKHGIRPAMMVTGSDMISTEALILRGCAAEGTRPVDDAFAMRTMDQTRSQRALNVKPPSQLINGVRLRVVEANSPPASVVMMYFQGLPVISDVNWLRYRPGAWLDNLTSYGANPGGGQTTVWQIIDAGATGSYGTVVEPYALSDKFPNIQEFVRIYTSGRTLIEAAWRSVGYPFQGLFVGDLLACPWAAA